MFKRGLLSGFLAYTRAKAVSKFISQARSQSILDIGCGKKPKVLAYIHSSNDYVGIDNDPAIIRYNTCQCKKAVFYPTDAQELGQVNGQYGIILALAFIEHMHLKSGWVKMLSSKLKANGIVVITTPHPCAKLLLEIGSRSLLFSKQQNQDHKQLFDKVSLMRGLEGFKLVTYKRFLFGFNQLFVFRKENAQK